MTRNQGPVFKPCTVPDFFLDLLNDKQIRNPGPAEIYTLFHNQEQYLEQWDVYVVGRIGQERKVFKMKLLSCEKRVLKGKHIVEVNGSEYEIDSLSTMKKEMGYEDKFSFERVAFIMIPEYHRAIRLSVVHQLFSLPLTNRFVNISDSFFYNTIPERTKVRPYVNIPMLRMYVNEHSSKDESRLLEHLRYSIHTIISVNPERFSKAYFYELVDAVDRIQSEQILLRQSTTMIERATKFIAKEHDYEDMISNFF